MHCCYLLPREHNAIAIGSLRHHPLAPPLKIDDPAVRAMTDFHRNPPLTVTEDLAVEEVLDEMFRLGMRAFLVVRERIVVGLITLEDARGELQRKLRVGNVMTASAELPAVDWQMIQAAQVRDLIEIFEGSGAQYLVVLQSEMANLSSVRGLVQRGRLERQLGAHGCGSGEAAS